ncbi:MAG: PD-(D/E)XK nuclease family protein [candidate division WOR-3 bacterium]
MKVLYVFEPDIKNKYYILLEKLKDFYSNRNNFIHFVPTLYKKIFLEEKIKEFFNERKYVFIPEIHTPSSFCEKFIKPILKKEIISDSKGFLFFHFALRKDKKLIQTFYKKKEVTGFESFSKKLFETYKLIRNYYPYGKFSEISKRKDVYDFLSRYPTLFEKIECVFNFFDEFEFSLEKENLLIESLILKEAVKSLENFKFDYILIDSFLDFTEIEKEFFERIISISKNVFANIENYKDEKIRLILDKTLTFYKEKGFEIYEIKEGEKRKKIIKFFKFPSQDEEIEGICKKIIYEKIRNGKNFSHFMISFPNLKKYATQIERTFYIYGLPYHISLKESLNNFPEAKIIFSLIDVYIRDFSYNSFINFITSPLLSKIDYKFKEIIPKYARIANVLTGRKYWENLIEVIPELKEEKSYQKQIDEKEFEIIKKNIEWIFDVLEDVDLEEKKEAPEWVFFIKKILEKFGYFDKLNNIKVLILSKFNELSEFKQKITIYEFKNLLYKIFEDEEIEAGLREKEGVRIIGLFELTGIENEILFFGGMNDGDFPKISEVDILLPDRLKRFLNMPDRKEIIIRDRLNFEKIKNNFDEIIFTFPSEEDERSLFPSPFIEDLKEVHEGFEEIKKFYIGDIEKEFEIGERMKFSIFDNFREEVIFPKNYFIKNISKIFPNKEIYVTDVVYYKRCPYKFYLKNLLGCEEIEEPSPTLKDVIIGRVIHKFMENFTKEFKKTNYDFKMFEDIYKLTLKSVVNNFKIPKPFKTYLEYYISYHEDLIREKERKRRERGFIPVYIEKSFRKRGNGFIIYGRIDRIDYSEKENLYEIIDYKTKTTEDEIDKFQLFLYLYLSEDILKGNEKCNALIYTFDEKKITKSESREELKERYEEDFKSILNFIKTGIFEAIPYKKDECNNCFFRNFCVLWIKEK